MAQRFAIHVGRQSNLIPSSQVQKVFCYIVQLILVTSGDSLSFVQDHFG